jgi:hypothetical protein
LYTFHLMYLDPFSIEYFFHSRLMYDSVIWKSNKKQFMNFYLNGVKFIFDDVYLYL